MGLHLVAIHFVCIEIYIQKLSIYIKSLCNCLYYWGFVSVDLLETPPSLELSVS